MMGDIRRRKLDEGESIENEGEKKYSKLKKEKIDRIRKGN